MGDSASSALENGFDFAALPPTKIRRMIDEVSVLISRVSQPMPQTVPIHSEVAHTLEELTIATTLSSMSGTDTSMIVPIQDQVPSPASEGNLGGSHTLVYPPERNIFGSRTELFTH